MSTDRWQSWAAPAFLALLVGLLTLLTPVTAGFAGLWGEAMVWGGTAWRVVLLLAGLSVVAGVVLGRRHPGWSTALAAWPFLVAPVVGFFVWSWWLGLLMVATLAAVDGWRRAVLPGVLTLGVAAVYVGSGAPALLPIGPVTATSPGSGDAWISLVLYVGVTLAAVAVAGALGAVRRAQRRSADAAEESRQARQTESVTAERARIARDLHDVVAHHISLVAVRAESAPYVHPEIGDAARPVLEEIARDARGALGELRQVLGVLQRAQDAERAPQPGAGDLAGLVETARAAGQDVCLTWSGTQEVPAAQGYVLFRTAQEALTNARRHSPGASVALDVSVGERSIQLRAINACASNDLPRSDSRDSSGLQSPEGRGLIGMRERVEALGGRLVAGVQGAEFVVQADLPPTDVSLSDAPGKAP